MISVYLSSVFLPLNFIWRRVLSRRCTLTHACTHGEKKKNYIAISWRRKLMTSVCINFSLTCLLIMTPVHVDHIVNSIFVHINLNIWDYHMFWKTIGRSFLYINLNGKAQLKANVSIWAISTYNSWWIRLRVQYRLIDALINIFQFLYCKTLLCVYVLMRANSHKIRVGKWYLLALPYMSDIQN